VVLGNTFTIPVVKNICVWKVETFGQIVAVDGETNPKYYKDLSLESYIISDVCWYSFHSYSNVIVHI
jgi:hypothetical protein